MMKLYLFAALGMCCISLVFSGTTWHARSPMLVKRSDMTATTVGDKIIVVGGCDSSQACPLSSEFCYCTSITDKVHAYSPKEDTWEILPVAPTARFRHAAAAVGSKLYVFGGRDVSDNIIHTVDVFDTETNIWSTLSSLWSNATSDLVGVSIGTTVYALGGYTTDYSSLRTVFTMTTIAANPAFTTALSIPGMNSERGDACGLADGSKILVYGGYTDLNFCQPLDTLEVFDTANPQAGWSSKQKLHKPRGDGGCGIAHGLFHALGGEQKDNATGCSRFSIPIQDVESYDFDTDSWTEENPMPDARFRSASATFEDIFYIFGGQGRLTTYEYQVLGEVESWYDASLVSAANPAMVPALLTTAMASAVVMLVMA